MISEIFSTKLSNIDQFLIESPIGIPVSAGSAWSHDRCLLLTLYGNIKLQPDSTMIWVHSLIPTAITHEIGHPIDSLQWWSGCGVTNPFCKTRLPFGARKHILNDRYRPRWPDNLVIILLRCTQCTVSCAIPSGWAFQSAMGKRSPDSILPFSSYPVNWQASKIGSLNIFEARSWHRPVGSVRVGNWIWLKYEQMYYR